MKKRFSLYFSLHIFIILMVFFIFSSEYHLVPLINIVFVLSFLYLIVTLFLYTKRGGFYDGITFSFRRFTNLMIERDYLEEWKSKPLPSEQRNDEFYHLVKAQSFALLGLLIILVVFYYV